MNELKTQYLDLICASRANDFDDNYDYRRFGAVRSRSLKRRLKDLIKSLVAATALYRGSNSEAVHLDELSALYTLLADRESKELLVKVLAYRALGHRKVKLPLNNAAYWGVLAQLDSMAEHAESIEIDFMDWRLNRLNLASYGYPLDIFGIPAGVYAQILLQQYSCVTDQQVIEVVAGDVVIDAGGCYGETALYFAYKGGEHGKVFSFEFLPDNLHVFKRNLALNPDYRDRITVVENAVWSSSTQALYVEGNGPGTRVSDKSNNPLANKVQTLAIDDLVARRALDHVEFIKMDIEGAELEALKGAEQTIRAYRPKLAISIYHRLSDFWEIPTWIDSLALDYQFYLRHFTIHSEETVLFALAPDSSDGI